MLVEDAALHASDEDEFGDLRDVDTGGKEIDSNRDLGVLFVFETTEEGFIGLHAGAGDLGDEGIGLGAVGGIEGVL